MKKPQMVELTVREVMGCPDYPPPKKFWDYLPTFVVGFLRRFANILPTPRERWYVARGMRIMLELTQAQSDKSAPTLTDPEEPPHGWN